MLDDVLTPAVQKAVLDHAPAEIYSDDLEWLDDLIERYLEEELVAAEVLAERLRDHFSAVRAVHGTRTDDVGSFYESGLLPLDPEALQQLAKDIFLGSGRFPELSELDLLQAFEIVGTNTRKGHVYFECNEPMLIALAGHYMLYGSEYLVAIAANLGRVRSQKYMRALQERGRPTLIVVDVPLSFISQKDLVDFSTSALSRLLTELVSGREIKHGTLEGAAFSVRERVPGECIVGHWHPEQIKDPLW